MGAYADPQELLLILGFLWFLGLGRLFLRLLAIASHKPPHSAKSQESHSNSSNSRRVNTPSHPVLAVTDMVPVRHTAARHKGNKDTNGDK
jgi:hypothetical protein